MKKVIFVGGTSYSGSTFFDMTLGNDPAGFSTGEVYALFHPFRPHHTNPPCGCGAVTCAIWPQVLEAGEESLYETLFAIMPELSFIVDSSKDPFWIEQQAKRLQQAGFETRHIVIWKTPLELAASFKKRGELDAWERSWVNYFRLYHTLVDDWRSIPYADYTQDTAVLPAVCDYLGIPFFDGKEAYWEKTHHLLFGNDSARVHLEGAGESKKGEIATGNGQQPERQTIYYRAVDDPQLQDLVAETLANSPYMAGLIDLLQARDVRRPQAAAESAGDYLKMNLSDVQLRRARQALRYGIGRLRYG